MEGQTADRAGSRIASWLPFHVLRHRDFTALWFAQSISILGSQLTAVATAVLGMKLAGDSALVFTLILAASTAPAVLFGWASGVLVDRWDKRTVLVVADVARGLLILTLVFVDVPWLGLLAVSFAVASFGAFFEPAVLGLVPRTVPEEDLMAANSLTQSTSSILNIAGYGVAALLISALGPKPAFFIDFLSYAVSALAILTVAVRTKPEAGAVLGFWEDLKAGLRYHRENPSVLGLLVMIVGLTLGIGVYNAMTTMAVDRLLGLPESYWGYLMAVASVTMALAGFWMSRYGKRYSRLGLLVGSYLVMGVTAIGFGLSRAFWLSMILAAVEGAVNAIQLIAMTTWVQQVAAKEMLGRVFAVRFAFGSISVLLATVFAGVLADRFGVDVMLFAAGGIFIIWGLMSLFMTSLRQSSTELQERDGAGAGVREAAAARSSADAGSPT